VICEEAADIYRWAWRLMIRALAWIAVLFGAALVFGGSDRFHNVASYAYATVIPGEHITWGLAAATTGAWTIGSSIRWHRRLVMGGLLAQCVIFGFFAVSIGASAAADHTAPFGGLVIYGGYSVLCSIAYVAGHELRRGPH
jgi:hypothetical protein